jgi:glutamyl-Q tRNA(Asp) synthetase
MTGIFRFAPSPNGYSARRPCAVRAAQYEMAQRRAAGSCCASRTSTRARCRREYEAAIYEDLAWLGIPGSEPVRRQSEHFDDYRAALARLEAMGSSIRASRAAARSRAW